eukprot:TRINITY_DN65441_c0_g1_i1.p1 TRINITY_DN65441_c0_g1~~TRINITY_DN65441_c0_g1_i1.p1  ORF type:complete len:241 (-),score=51.28 TRINITY_DN65441_c0_g1_i1:91-813(-)
MQASQSGGASSSTSTCDERKPRIAPRCGARETAVPPDDGDEVGEQTKAQRENRILLESEIRALQIDDFLLGADRKPALRPPARGVDHDVAELDVALRCKDLPAARAIWRRLSAALGDPCAELAGRPELRAVVARYATTVLPHVLDDLEHALDRGDRHAAQQEHARLEALRTVAEEEDAQLLARCEAGRTAQLEARYQQLVHRTGPLVCGMLPDLFGLPWTSCCSWDAVQQSPHRVINPMR